MINLTTEEFSTKLENEEAIKSNMAKHTCKTNLNPQLMLKQSYTGHTDKAFVGNWTDYGFWISKFKLQLLQFRPDIIAKFYLTNRKSSFKH